MGCSRGKFGPRLSRRRGGVRHGAGMPPGGSPTKTSRRVRHDRHGDTGLKAAVGRPLAGPAAPQLLLVFRLKHGGKVYFFSSEENLNKFQENLEENIMVEIPTNWGMAPNGSDIAAELPLQKTTGKL